MGFAREAWPFVLPPAAAAIVLFVLGMPTAAAASSMLTVLLLLFFRDPVSRFEGPDDLVLAAAWGKVLRVEPAEDPAVAPEPLQRIVTFLSVFDVHLQRAPISGRVVHCMASPGRRVAAFRHDAGEVNAGRLTVLEDEHGDRVGVRQIAGLLARRVVCYFHPGRQVARGETLGLIKFGSRVDLLVPRRYEVLVRPGERLRGGSTPVARPVRVEGPPRHA
ncbi:MAG TPA: phosphatidylserine decarboxylase [Thermoanaerobaculia bacterium]|nr:phosphatidylserine decarboxylase [Thermoanaerobaculia bacterium]